MGVGWEEWSGVGGSFPTPLIASGNHTSCGFSFYS